MFVSLDKYENECVCDLLNINHLFLDHDKAFKVMEAKAVVSIYMYYYYYFYYYNYKKEYFV